MYYFYHTKNLKKKANILPAHLRKVRDMVLILDGYSELCARVRGTLCFFYFNMFKTFNYIENRYKSDFFSFRRDLFSFKRARHVLSYHLIKVTRVRTS